jgi:hypothetical protein
MTWIAMGGSGPPANGRSTVDAKGLVVVDVIVQIDGSTNGAAARSSSGTTGVGRPTPARCRRRYPPSLPITRTDPSGERRTGR